MRNLIRDHRPGGRHGLAIEYAAESPRRFSPRLGAAQSRRCWAAQGVAWVLGMAHTCKRAQAAAARSTPRFVFSMPEAVHARAPHRHERFRTSLPTHLHPFAFRSAVWSASRTD